MNEKLRDAQTDILFDAILGLETREDCYRLFAHSPAGQGGPE